MQPEARVPAGGQDTFGSLLRRFRVQAGLSQEALAARAGLSRRGIADLERGARRTPYPDTVRRLAGALSLADADRKSFVAACRPASSSVARHYLLGTEPTPIVGRERELAEITRLAASTRLLTLTGAGGIGKTRLALELAQRRQPIYANGVVVVDLASVSSEEGVPDAVAAGLGVGLRPGDSTIDAVGQHLHEAQLLIMLDNCEHVVTATAQLADALLRRLAGLTLMTTSREPLRIQGETAWIVPPLQQDEAVELFVRRAGDAAATRQVTPAEIATIEAMCRHLEGIPLAIELAAVRVPALGVDQVSGHLSDRLGFLSRGSRLDPPRHQTLRSALDWSYALLDAGEQRLLARLSVFVGGWSLEGAQALGETGDEVLGTALDGLAGLVEKSLVLVEDTAGRRRYRFLETIREYALELLRTSGEENPVRERLAAYMLMLAREGAMSRLGVPYPGDLAQVRLEHANLRAALRWQCDQQRYDDGLALCHALSGYWVGQGFLREGDEWFTLFLADPDRISLRLRADGWHAWARLSQYAGNLDRAQELFEASLADSAEHDDAVAARALCGLADVALHRGTSDAALELFEEALNRARIGGGDAEIAQGLRGLGRTASLLGDVDAARAWLGQALTIERRIGDRWGIAYVLQVLGEQALQAGELERAQTLLEEGHVLWRQAGTLMGERAAVLNLTLVTLARGETVRAAELAADALELSQELRDGGSSTTVRAVEVAALVLQALDQLPIAVSLLAAADERRTTLGAPRPAAEQTAVDELHTAAWELGGLEVERWRTAGLALSADQAVELAASTLATSVVTR